MTPKVSVLVPVYNVSRYIDRFAKSLFNQTFDNMEFVFVDDASTDDSMLKLKQIIEQYPDRQEHIQIVTHPSNKGLATARNSAIDNSTGEYILFVDSDDYLEPNMVEMLYAEAIRSDADIVFCGAILHRKNRQCILVDPLSPDSDNYLEHILFNDDSMAYVWNKLIKRTLYKEDCRVPEGLNYLEDKYVTTRLYYYAKKIRKIDQILYHYNKTNLSSITASKDYMHFENVQRFWILTEDFLKEKGILAKYQPRLDKEKAISKIRLMIETSSYRLRKDFKTMFEREEKEYFSAFRLGEKIMSLCIRNRCFFIAQLWHYALEIKNKLPEMLSPQQTND